MNRTEQSLPPGRTETKVVIFGTYDEARHPRVRVLREALGEAGYEVLTCNQPIRLSTADRVRLLRQPWRLLPAGVRLLGNWFSLVKRARSLDRSPAAVLVGYLGVFDVHLAKLLFRAPILLDNMAPVGGIARDRDLRFAKLLDLVDSAAQASADLLIADTHEHLPEGHTNAITLAVGAPDAWFAARSKATVRSDSKLSVVFFGLFTPLQGATTIGEAINALSGEAGFDFTLIGAGQDRPAVEELISANDSVRFVDWVDASDLPAEVASHDVCLGIFGDTAKARRVVPNKVFQGAAAGCVVVTSDTAPQRRALGNVGVFVPPQDPVALAATLRSLRDDLEFRQLAKQQTAAHADEHFSPTALVPAVQAAVEQARR